MKQSILYTGAFLLILCLTAFAAEPDSDMAAPPNEALLTFLENTYEVVGRYPDSGAIYSGTVTLTRKDNDLVMTRDIKGKKITGIARIVAATADAVSVLQAEFSEGKQKYQATYMIGSDLDNYARPTGKVYFAGKETKKPGLEAMFIILPPEK